MTVKNRPVHQIRLGRIKAVIWGNESPHGVRYNVNLTRIYKDGEQWKSSDSLGRDDLLMASKALDLAHTWIVESAVVPAASNGH